MAIHCFASVAESCAHDHFPIWKHTHTYIHTRPKQLRLSLTELLLSISCTFFLRGAYYVYVYMYMDIYKLHFSHHEKGVSLL